MALPCRKCPSAEDPDYRLEALITAVAFIPGFSTSSSDAPLVIEAIIVTDGATSMMTCVGSVGHCSLQARCSACRCLRAASAVSSSIAR